MAKPDESSSEAERLHAELKAAREDWVAAGAELKQALALFRDLNRTPASSDGNLALRNARLRESEALKKYIAAVNLYGDVVLRAGGVVPPES